MPNGFVIFWKKLFGAPLTDLEKIYDHKGPVLVANPRENPRDPKDQRPDRTLVPQPATPQARPSTPGAPNTAGSATGTLVPPSTPNGAAVAPAPSPGAAGAGNAGIPSPTPQTPPSAPAPLTRFEKAVHFLLENEDGKRWDHDNGCFTFNPGGHSDPPTKWGVTQEEYSRFLGFDLAPAQVALQPREVAVQIYRKFFWEPVRGDAYLEESTAIAVMDTAVNKGLGGCKLILTDACHQTFRGEAWEYGPDLIAAVNSLTGQSFLNEMTRAVLNYIEARICKYPAAEWARAGWTNRARRLQKILTWSAQ